MERIEYLFQLDETEIDIFMEMKTPPDRCYCGCGMFQYLFTEYEQRRCYRKRGKYRLFANHFHLARYKNIYHFRNTILLP